VTRKKEKGGGGTAGRRVNRPSESFPTHYQPEENKIPSRRQKGGVVIRLLLGEWVNREVWGSQDTQGAPRKGNPFAWSERGTGQNLGGKVGTLLRKTGKGKRKNARQGKSSLSQRSSKIIRQTVRD